MKIGIDARCLEWQRGGVSRYLINMLKIWPRISDKNTFVLYFQNNIPEDDFLKNSKFELKLITGPKILKSHRIICEQILMPRQLAKDKLDIYMGTWYTLPLLYKSSKTVVAAWDISYSTHPQHYAWKHRISLGYFSQKSCNKANGVITCSEFDANQISKYYGVQKEKILTVHLAADQRFKTERNEALINEVRRKYGLPEKFILSLGVIHNRRNVDVVIKSFLAIKDEYPDFSLIVIGKNSTEPKLNINGLMREIIAEKRGLYSEWFDDKDLPLLYQAAHAYICTSTVDGETIMLKEAMKSGTPVITSPLLKGAIGGHGLIIEDPYNVSETASILRVVMGKDDFRNQRIEAGLRWNEAISWERAAKESLDFINTR